MVKLLRQRNTWVPFMIDSSTSLKQTKPLRASLRMYRFLDALIDLGVSRSNHSRNHHAFVMAYEGDLTDRKCLLDVVVFDTVVFPSSVLTWIGKHHTIRIHKAHKPQHPRPSKLFWEVVSVGHPRVVLRRQRQPRIGKWHQYKQGEWQLQTCWIKLGVGEKQTHHMSAFQNQQRILRDKSLARPCSPFALPATVGRPFWADKNRRVSIEKLSLTHFIKFGLDSLGLGQGHPTLNEIWHDMAIPKECRETTS